VLGLPTRRLSSNRAIRRSRWTSSRTGWVRPRSARCSCRCTGAIRRRGICRNPRCWRCVQRHQARPCAGRSLAVGAHRSRRWRWLSAGPRRFPRWPARPGRRADPQ
jgi:hypothetical protein